MSLQDKARIGAYLLGQMSEGDREEFEARMLAEPDLLRVVKQTEAEILAGSFRRESLTRTHALCFSAGAVSGVLLTEVMHLLF